MIELDLAGEDLLPDGPPPERIAELVVRTLDAAGIDDGHVAVEVVTAERIAELNLRHRGREGATDVLSFPVDGAGESIGPREIGDIAIFPDLCESIERALVHGALHLAGFDHETDNGEMLELEQRLLEGFDGV